MSQIQITAGLSHNASRVNLNSAVAKQVAEGFKAIEIPEVDSVGQTLSFSELASVGTLYLENLERSMGGLVVSVDGGNSYPFRLEPDQGNVFSLNTQETTHVTAIADDRGSLAGKYFGLEDRNGPVRAWLDFANGVPEISSVYMPNPAPGIGGEYFDIYDDVGPVRVWANTAAAAEVSDVQVVTGSSIAGKYFDIYDDAGPVRVWIEDNGAGTAPTAPSGGRLLKVALTQSPTVGNIAAAITTTLDGDSKFSATDDGVDTVTITDASTGARTDISEPDSGTYFSVSVDQQGVAAATAPSTPSGGRLLPISLSAYPDGTELRAAAKAAVDGDAKFSAVLSGQTLEITDASPGTRTDISDSGSGHFFPSVTQQGTDSTAAPSAPAGGRLLAVSLALNNTAAQNAAAVAGAFEADDEFTAAANADTAAITDKHPGARTNATAETSGFTVSTPQEGANTPAIHVKSTSTCGVIYGAAPV